MPTTITETRPKGGIAVKEHTAIITLITPGQGSSGFYSAEVLEQAAKDKVFHSGLHMFLDHADQEHADKYPVGRVNELAAVLLEDARWSGDALVARARIFEPYAEMLAAKQEHIGVSIRCYADFTPGKPGQPNRIDKITEALSVDFVTQAGRGGFFVIEESVKRAIRRGVNEATANQTRDALNDALKERYGAENTYVWLRDYDTGTVWFEHETPSASGIYQIAYSSTDDTVTLAEGDPVEVRQHITYLPVNQPAGQSKESNKKEKVMPEISETELAQLRNTAGLAEAAVKERDELKTKLAAAEQDKRKQLGEANIAKASAIVADAFKGVKAPKLTETLAKTFPTTDDGVIDEDAFRTSVDEAVAELAEATGVGKVAGFGGSTPSGTVTEESVDTKAGRIFDVKGN